jgi:hypothetical protein
MLERASKSGKSPLLNAPRQHGGDRGAVALRQNGATFDAIPPQVDGASVSLALAGVVTPGNPLIGDGGRRSPLSPAEPGLPSTPVPAPGKPTPAVPHLHIKNVNAYPGRA